MLSIYNLSIHDVRTFRRHAFLSSEFWKGNMVLFDASPVAFTWG